MVTFDHRHPRVFVFGTSPSFGGSLREWHQPAQVTRPAEARDLFQKTEGAWLSAAAGGGHPLQILSVEGGSGFLLKVATSQTTPTRPTSNCNHHTFDYRRQITAPS
ncbi:hypothetical protein PGTUg99_017678 [Puccinia graminis f. sp. tritici]|uniref:Uncharacterized protein n=1 Tax=Puccinia graminis f. sp. tritici TaxID=56615 RepID=A0A5B0S0B5_PUCGR|nr:hypothetical protein PGTUg99_017678 [Puccinia graminis f. sp. tritici]